MKKTVTVLLAIVCLLMALSLSAFASETHHSTEAPTITVDSVAAFAGNEVTVAINIINSPGIVSMKVQVAYDAAVLQLVEHTAADLSTVTFGPKTTNPLTVNWCDAANPVVTGNKTFARLTFKVRDNVTGGTISSISVRYDAEDVYNTQFENVTFGTKDGKVTVKQAVSGISLNKSTLSVKTGSSSTLAATIQPANASNKSVTWKSSNTQVATISDTGVVKGIKEGKSTITATTADGGYTATCAVTVSCAHKNTTDYSAVASTCKVQGHGAYTKCNDCGRVIEGDDAKLALAKHTYKSVVTKATLEKNGKINYKCNKCGYIASTSKDIQRPTSFTLSTTSYTYNGSTRKPTVTVKDASGKTLVKDTDYKVTYPSACKNAGKYTVKVTMMGHYSGTKSLTYTINPIDISKCTIKLSTTAYTYNGSTKTPSVTVKNASGTKLTKDTHYTVTYASGRIKTGSYTVKVTMKDNYKGAKTLTFKINPVDVSKCSIKLSATAYTYNGSTKTPSVTVKNASGKSLVKNTDYTVTYASGRKNVGTYKVTVKMKGNYKGTKTLTFKINPINVSKCTIKLSASSYTYNGSAKTPSVTVKNASGKSLVKNTDYTVTYASGRKNVGSYKVTIKMKGNYTGTKTLTFKINPKAASINSLTTKSKAISVKLNRSLQQSTGYQIQYATSSKFTSASTKTLSSYTTSTTTLSGLKAKTKYYVRVRTYKTVGNTRYYSNWSTAKSVITK